jgi:hypothetical protein
MSRAMSLRLPDSIKVEASAYAKTLGISLNGLLAVALRDYLDARKPRLDPVREGLPPESVAKPARAASKRSTSTKPSTPTYHQDCPCGSGKKYGKCHGKGGAA